MSSGSNMIEETKALVARSAAHAPFSLELPAPMCVCGLLVVAALTKGGLSQPAIGGMVFFYLLYLVAQYAKWRAFARTRRTRCGEFTA